MDKQKILVTGSGGFILSNFIRKTLKDHSCFNIASIDRVNSSKVINTIYANKNHTFHIGDVCDEHFLNVIFEIEKPDIVVHGAVEYENSKSMLNTNIIGTSNIINACKKYNIKKLVYLSTYKVYGHLNSEEESSYIEEDHYNSETNFITSKVSAELLVKNSGLNYNIARLSNNYGPRQPKSFLIPSIISNIYEEKEVNLYGQGLDLRTWTHVQDSCDAILNIINNGATGSYNISSGHEFSNIEIFHKLATILGRGHELLKFIDNKEDNFFRFSGSNKKIKELGWSPKFKINDGLNHTTDWYINNKWFLK